MKASIPSECQENHGKMVVSWCFNGIYPLVIQHGWLENPLSMEVLIGKPLISGPFSTAMFDYQKVLDMYDMEVSKVMGVPHS